MSKTMIKFKKTTNNKPMVNKPVIRFKKLDKTKNNNDELNTKIQLYKTDSFLKEYLKENETPSTFMEKMAMKTSYLVFVKDNNKMDIDAYLELVKESVDINLLFGIADTSGYKLKKLHVLYDTIQTTKNLLNIIYYLEGRGLDPYKEFDNDYLGAREIRFRLQSLLYAANNMHAKIVTKKKTMIMSEGVVLETRYGDFDDYLELDNNYDLLVEVYRNRFFSIPAKAYKSLMFIKKFTANIQVVCMEDEEVYEEYRYDYDKSTVDAEHGCIARLMTLIDTIDNIADVKSEEGINNGLCWEVRGTFSVDFGSYKSEMSLNEFYSTYIKFL